MVLLRVVPALIFASGCYLDWGGSGEDAGGVGSIPTTCPRIDRQLFLISSLRVGQADPAGDPMIVPGTNLDGLVSTDSDAEGCFHADFTSPAPDEEPGVDNQLGPVLGGLGDSFDADGSWHDAIMRGELLLLLRLRADGAACRVELLRGLLPEGTTALIVDEVGRPVADQIIDIVPASVVSYDDTDVRRDSRLRTISSPSLAIPLFLSRGSVDLLMHDSDVRFSITTMGPSLGVISGAADVEDVLGAGSVLLPDIDPGLIRMIVEGQADLAPDAGGLCRRVSLSIVFETVPAVMGAVR